MSSIRHSVCALDCPDACSMLVHVDGDRAIRLQGDPKHPITQGFLCSKVTRYLDREYSPQRVLYPHRRTGPKGSGQFARITWDEALDEIADRLKAVAREHGSEAILPYSYGGNMGYLNGQGMDRRFFHRLGATQLDRTICASAGAVGLQLALGARYGVEPQDFIHAKTIIAWGANILATNVHLWPFLVEARRRGAKFYVIDPVGTRTAKLADRHFAVNPGSDLSLALGMMHVMFEEGLADLDYLNQHAEGVAELREHVQVYTPERVGALTGLSAEDIILLAREYAGSQPSVIRLNYGVQRSDRGGAAVRAITMLAAVAGAWKHQGGGMQLSTSGTFQLNKRALEMPELQQAALGREARVVNMSMLGSVLNEWNDPPVKAMVVYNCNPAAVAPEQNRVVQGLLRDDLFTVVMEQFPTDTADYADILLPATTFLENTDLYYSYGHCYLQMARPAVPPPGEARSNVEVFRALAKRMGFTEPCFDDTEDDMIRTLLNTDHPFVRGITLERLDAEKYVRLQLPEPFLPFAEGFETNSRKCDLRPDGLDYDPPVESRHGDPALRRSFPLELISSKNAGGLNTTFGFRQDVDAETSTIYLHPEDAGARGISSGDAVRIFNARGECELTAAVSADRVRPGLVHTSSVRWGKLARGGRNVNALTSGRLTDMGGGPTFFSCLVQVERCASTAASH